MVRFYFVFCNRVTRTAHILSMVFDRPYLDGDELQYTMGISFKLYRCLSSTKKTPPKVDIEILGCTTLVNCDYFHFMGI